MEEIDNDEARFLALTTAYVELVRALVESKVLDKSVMPERLEGAAKLLAEKFGDDATARFVRLIRIGVTPND